jgi:YD repeat-containing protein
MPTVTTTYVIGNGNNGAGANQIASETTSGVTTAYAYDGNGNRTGRTISGNTDTFSYDYENRLTSLDYLTGSSGTGMYTYTYD